MLDSNAHISHKVHPNIGNNIKKTYAQFCWPENLLSKAIVTTCIILERDTVNLANFMNFPEMLCFLGYMNLISLAPPF